MSVEDTLTERGKRYGDFTDHAEICQRIKLAMIAGSARWARLSDVQKQALEVIADKIARILSGDPNYADNWHDIQGYAKLVEDRLPKAPMTFSERCAEIDAQVHAAAGRIRQEGETIIVSTPEQHAAIYAALGAVPNADGGTVSIHFGAQPFCVECEHPDDGTGTHYTSCSKLTAPKEFVEQVEATFDELEADTGRYCPECHVPAGYLHLPDCLRMRQLKQRTDKLLDDAVADQRGIGAALQDSVDNARAALEAMKNPPVEDPFAGAPEWAKYKAQDAVGDWCWYSHKPVDSGSGWMCDEADVESTWDYARKGDPSPNWRDTLIERP